MRMPRSRQRPHLSRVHSLIGKTDDYPNSDRHQHLAEPRQRLSTPPGTAPPSQLLPNVQLLFVAPDQVILAPRAGKAMAQHTNNSTSICKRFKKGRRARKRKKLKSSINITISVTQVTYLKTVISVNEPRRSRGCNGGASPLAKPVLSYKTQLAFCLLALMALLTGKLS